MQAHGAPPKAMYLRNHGFVALGRSEAEALAITDMAVKAAQVLATTLVAGGPRYLPEAEVRRIAGRADEHYRQKALGLTSDERSGGDAH
jgi:ribulose-5-phosphate 4-epimerase/fuculose-1-phosphate aldolase